MLRFARNDGVFGPELTTLANRLKNLFVALKTLVLPKPYRTARLKTLLFRLLGIPALVVYHARRLYLKLPRGHPHFAAFQAASA